MKNLTQWRTWETATVEETAAILRISRNMAYMAVQSGDIPTIRVRTRRLVPVAWLRKQLDGQEAA